MERSIRRSPVASVLVTAALVVSALVALSPSAADAAIPFPDTERISASNAVDVGIAISKQMFAADAAGGVVLTRSDKFPDGLAASALAGEKSAPVLFTASNSLDPKSRTELDRVLPNGGTVYLMGGEVALAAAIENELKVAGYKTVRFGGEDRVDTAARTATVVGPGPNSSAMLVRGRGLPGQDNTQGWPDAISCGGYAADTNTPVLLTDPNKPDLPARTVETLQSLGITRVNICGGPAAVPNDHASELSRMGISVARFAGDTRVTTAIDVSKRLWPTATPDGTDFLIVNGWGENFAYGIAAAPLSGRLDAPILIVNTNDPTTWPINCSSPPTINSATLCYLAGTGSSRVASLTIVGSTGVISDAVHVATAKAAGLPEDTSPPSVPGNVKATDKPEDDGTNLDVSWTASTDDAADDIVYTVYYRASSEDDFDTASATQAGTVTNGTSLSISGLTAGSAYDVAVTATDEFDNTSAASAKATATPTDEVPATPASAPNLANQPGPAVVVSWLVGEADVAGYKVERAAPGTISGDCSAGVGFGGAEWGQIAQVDGRTTLSYRDDDVAAGDEYCYRYRKFDTTGNETGTSPVAEITVDEVSEDATPPSGTPSFYAVNYDQQEGLINGPAASKTEKQNTRFDVLVPAGAFANGEGGKVLVRRATGGPVEQGFVATGAEQVVSVQFSFPGGSGSSEGMTATMADAAGNESLASEVWSLTVDPQAPPTPRIVLVDGVNTDPASYTNQRVPTVGADTPRVNPRPTVRVEGISQQTAAAQRIDLYHQGIRVTGACISQGGASQSYRDFTVDMVTGTNNLVASITTQSDCGGFEEEFVRSGDSNTAKYIFNAGSFGVTDSFPRPATADLNAYADATQFSVTFNKDAAVGSKLTLRRANTTTAVASTTLSSAASTIALDKPLAFGPGSWELVVDASASDAPSQTSDAVIAFDAGFIHWTSVSAAVSVNTAEPNLDDPDKIQTTANEEDYELTFVVAPAAPRGRYRVLAGPSGTVLGTVNHSGGTESRSGSRTADPMSYDEAGEPDFNWTYESCDPGTQSPDPAACDNAGATAPQGDGKLPAVPTAPQISSLGLRQDSGNAFRLEGAGSLASRAYPWELVYRPTITSSGLSTFRSDAQVARRSDGSVGLIDNAAVRAGSAVRYYVRDLASGNESDLVADGVLRALGTVFPTNGLGNTEGQLESSDTLVLEFPNASFDGGLSDDGTVDAGLQIFANELEIEPHFETSGSGSGASRDFLRADRLVVTFGSGATIGGNLIPRASSPPTSVHGGLSVRGLNWAVDTTNGHAVLLPDSGSPVSNNTTF